MSDPCYCGYTGLNHQGCKCGIPCEVCDEQAVPGAGKLNLCEFHLHAHLAGRAEGE
jgi:hypothetical protein